MLTRQHRGQSFGERTKTISLTRRRVIHFNCRTIEVCFPPCAPRPPLANRVNRKRVTVLVREIPADPSGQPSRMETTREAKCNHSHPVVPAQPRDRAWPSEPRGSPPFALASCFDMGLSYRGFGLSAPQEPDSAPSAQEKANNPAIKTDRCSHVQPPAWTVQTRLS